MFMKRSLLARTLIATLAIMSAAFSMAQVVAYGTLSNFDIVNNTDQETNDFHVTLGGIRPDQIIDIYDDQYPNVVLTVNSDGSITISWSGNSTPPGGVAHFGVTLDPSVDMSKYPTFVRYTWTRDGIIVADLPQQWQGWVWDGRRFVEGDVVRNLSQYLIFVERRIFIRPGPMELAELMPGQAIWNASQVIDSAPVPVEPGGVLTFDFPPTRNYEFVVMSYTVTDREGRVVGRWMNATNVRGADSGTGGGRRMAFKSPVSARPVAKAVKKSKPSKKVSRVHRKG